MRRLRGFTLIELMVGLSVTLLVTSALMSTLVELRRQAVQSRVSGDLNRNARMVMSMMARHLKMAGAGMPIPSARSVDPVAYPNGGVPYSGAADPSIGGPVIVARASAIGLVGDYARPDSNFNGVSTPAHGEAYQRYSAGGSPPAAGCAIADKDMIRDNDSTNHTTIINELSGGCLAGAGCNTQNASIVLPGYGADCLPSATGLAQPTCPWGLNKYRPGEYFLIVYPSNLQWVNRQITNNSFASSHSAYQGDGPPIHTHCKAGGQFQGMSFFYDRWGGNTGSGNDIRNMPPVYNWDNDTESEISIIFPVNRGWISTPERVFFRFDAAVAPATTGTLSYNMCWGPFASRELPKWTSLANGTTGPCKMAAHRTDNSNSAADGDDQYGGTDWQVIATDVENFTVTYFNLSDTALATPVATQANLDSISRVNVSITLSQNIGGKTAKSTQSTSIQLRARRFR